MKRVAKKRRFVNLVNRHSDQTKLTAVLPDKSYSLLYSVNTTSCMEGRIFYDTWSADLENRW